jgi:hypothetical protein
MFMIEFDTHKKFKLKFRLILDGSQDSQTGCGAYRASYQTITGGTPVRTDVRCSVRRLLVAACVVPSSPIFVTLMKEAPDSSETSVLKESRDVTSPKTALFIVTTVETSSLTLSAPTFMSGF